MLKILQAKDGTQTLSWNDVFIHSAYSPQKECERFLDRTLIAPPQTVILCGETLGFLYREIRRRYPGTRILTVYYHAGFLKYFTPDEAPFWVPGASVSLHGFLKSQLSLLESGGIELVCWQASGTAFPEISTQILQDINQFMLEASGSLSVIRQFGKKWFRNSLTNLQSLEQIVPFRIPADKPVIIAASGPSLSESFPLIRSLRKSVYLIALPSSLLALLENGIHPDVVVQTDPGYYAEVHLQPLTKLRIPVAMPLTACRGVWRSSSPVQMFLQDSYPEKTLTALTGKSLFEILPANGTVAVTALQLALRTRVETPVIMAGFDLASRDVRCHVHPPGFDVLIEQDTRRTIPLLSALYGRAYASSLPVRASGSGDNSHPMERQTMPLRTYSGWINRFGGSLTRKIYRLFPSGVRLDGFTEADPDFISGICREFENKASAGSRPVPVQPIPAEQRKQWTADLLKFWIHQVTDLQDHAEKVIPEHFFGSSVAEELLLPLCFLKTQDLRKAHTAPNGAFQKHFRELLQEALSLLHSWKGEYLR